MISAGKGKVTHLPLPQTPITTTITMIFVLMMMSQRGATPTREYVILQQTSSPSMSFFRKLGVIKRQQSLLQYNVTLPDGTERQFELEVSSALTDLRDSSVSALLCSLVQLALCYLRRRC